MRLNRDSGAEEKNEEKSIVEVKNRAKSEEVALIIWHKNKIVKSEIISGLYPEYCLKKVIVMV